MSSLQVQGTHSQDSVTTDSDGSKVGEVIFLLNSLPIIEHHPGPLQRILSSELNAAGLIRHIIVDFGEIGCYEIKTNARPMNRVVPFTNQLRRLFLTGSVLNENGEDVWLVRDHFSVLLSTTPTNFRKIGCIHGTGFLNHEPGPIGNLDDYIRAASNEQVLLFVIGRMDPRILSRVDDLVNVIDYPRPTDELNRIIELLEHKWGIA
ncbi:unnamed protein product [Sphenostylis stenocarpa]|uniref:Uncharacterized protein n=1 Tax=Sphenostylis stenocarpa TaxID=92480 RepID=A0AA86SUU9_9FABA|nr:unnamed protein product [Sphenostylis stenocarpa]